MAAVAVVNDSVQIHDMGDTAGDGTTGLSSIGGGSQPAANEDFVYQGDRSIGRKVGTSLAGFAIDASTTGGPVDTTAADRRIYVFKGGQSNFGALLNIGAPAGEIRLGSSSSNYYTIQLFGGDTYPVRGGTLIIPVSINHAAYVGTWNETGTVDETAIDYFAIRSDNSATSKGDNLYADSLDFGVGLTLVGGDGGDADGVFQDFIDDDEGGSSPTHRFGFFSTFESVVLVVGDHWIGRDEAGTTTATVFQDDTGKTFVFPDGLMEPGDARFQIDLGNATTDVDWEGHTFKSNGKGYQVRFDTEDDVVGGATDEVQLAALDDAVTHGDYVVIRDQGGAETPGVSDGTNYWVGKTATGVRFYTGGRDDALSDTSAVGLSASSAGNGEIWLVEKAIDTRAQLSVTGTSGAFDVLSCTFENFGDVTLTSACALDTCLLRDCGGTFTQSNAAVTDCEFLRPDMTEANAYITADNLADFSGCIFTSGGRGHALRGTATGTVAMVGNTYSGYFGVADQTLHQFDNTTDVSSGNDEITLPTGHGYVTGDPVVYSATVTANTALTNLTEGDTYYVNVTGDVVTLHTNEGDALNDNNPINLTAGSGNETHALWPANAAYHNDSGGAVTINISGGGNTPSVRNSLDCTTTVSNPTTHTVTNLRTGDRVIWIRQSDEVELENLVESSGTAAYSYNYVSDTDVWVQILSGDNTKKNTAPEVTLGNTDQSLPAVQADDPTYNNP